MNNTSRMIQHLCLLCVVFVVGGCASVQEPQRSTPLTPLVTETLLDDAIRYDTEDARVAQFWSAAEQARLEQRDDVAMGHLLQALEISPHNSIIWSRAAELHMRNEQAALAENYAMKSNTFAGTNNALLYRNWLIIEYARGVRGDLLGVRSAHKKVQEFQYQYQDLKK